MVVDGVDGLGAAVTTRLAAEGADVAYTYRCGTETEDLTTSLSRRRHRRGFAVAADHGVPAHAGAVVARIVQHFGRLDVVVVAGVDLPTDPCPTLLAAVPFLPDGARIVTIAPALDSPLLLRHRRTATDTATAAGCIGFAVGLARDLLSRAITVNLVLLSGRKVAASSRADHDGPARVPGVVAFLVGPDAGGVTGSQLFLDVSPITKSPGRHSGCLPGGSHADPPA